MRYDKKKKKKNTYTEKYNYTRVKEHTKHNPLKNTKETVGLKYQQQSTVLSYN